MFGKLAIFFSRRGVLVFLGLCLLSFVIWMVGPELGILDKRTGLYQKPLGEVSSRIVAIAALFLIWLLVLLGRWLWAVVTAARLRNEVVAPKPSQAEHQIEQIEQAFEDALNAQEQQVGGGGKRSLATLPWYIVLGPSGVGKTELLQTSGLDFPYEGTRHKKYVDGSGGTLNCKWWFGRDAVVLDTAGRYMQQDQHGEADRAEWQRFLALLKKHRRRQPLNGVVAVISADDVLRYGVEPQSMAEEAQRLRSRIDELQSAFGFDLPVYLLISKTDLVAGFSQFFRDMNSDTARAQVWGFDVDCDRHQRNGLGLALHSGFEQLTGRLRERALHRLNDEGELRNSIPVQSFPWQLAKLFEPLEIFINKAFGSDGPGSGLWLQGVYLTSATQTGAPIDQLTSSLSKAFGIAEVEQSRAGGDGFSYFVRDLFTNKIFPERDLVGESGYFRRSRTLSVRAASMVGTLALVTTTGVWFTGFRENTQRLDTANQQLYAARVAVPEGEQRTDPDAILAYLDKLVAFKSEASASAAQVGLLNRLGISVLQDVSDQAEALYAAALRDYFSPYLAALLYSELLHVRSQQAEETQELWRYAHDEFQIIEYLRSFTEPEKLNESERKAQILNWFIRAFEVGSADDAAQLARLKRHLDYFGTNPLPAVDFSADAVVQSINNFAVNNKIDLAFDLMRGSLVGLIGRQIDLTNSPNKSIFCAAFECAGIDEMSVIPGIYTRLGLETLLEKDGLDEFLKDYKKRVWVLGEDYTMPSDKSVAQGIKQRYAERYIATWNQALDSLSIRSVYDSSQGRTVVSTVVSPRSPIREVLKKVYEHTHLAKDDQKASNAVDVVKRLAQRNKAGRTLSRLSPSAAAAEVSPRDVIHDYFAELNAVSDGGSGLAEIDDILRRVADALRIFHEPDSQAQVVGELDAICQQQQPPLKNWLCSLAAASSDAVASSQRAEAEKARSYEREGAEKMIVGEYRSDVLRQCQQILHGRYPVNQLSIDEISIEDFKRMFGPGGVLDSFTNGPLNSHVNRRARPWRWDVSPTKDALQLTDELVRSMESAAQVREMFFPLPLTLSFEARQLDARLTEILLLIDGQQFRYRNDPIQTVSIQWPLAESSGVDLVMTKLDGSQLRKRWSGPWALFKALGEASVEKGEARGLLLVTFSLDGHTARVRINTNRAIHPWLKSPLTGFRCPAL